MQSRILAVSRRQEEEGRRKEGRRKEGQNLEIAFRLLRGMPRSVGSLRLAGGIARDVAWGVVQG